ncbi:MAG TPA: SpoIIE family protein phosphatase [Solirubrobacteraceae bacterium]|jgi:serine phosphatase RsbU (regulator of sigma subunit)/anti-sigma regulatory factor (Ser/Thr protein kinase)|nr:SpoIIE family protein phosphatase [Solirubrobacteraceae bacterium]
MPGGDPAARAAALSGADPARLEHIRRIADSALSYLSLEDALSELLDRIRSALEADTAAILLLDEDRNVLLARAARGLEEEVRQGVQVPLHRGFAGRVAAENRPIVIEDMSHADVVNPILRQRGIRSMLGVPLRIEGRVIGVMHIGTLHQRIFNDADTTLLQLAADRAALAIDDGRLTEQRSVTEIMQRTLLPEALPEVPGVRFSAKYLPAGTGFGVGGDWYDIFHLANGKLAFVIGDVVGRGVLAASVMAEVRTALRAYLVEGHDLGDTMALLNDLLVSMGRHRGATAAVLALDLEAQELELVLAGHPPPVVVAPNGEPSFLEAPAGIPIGIVAGEEYEPVRRPLPAGSALLLYTDGLIERPGEPLEACMDRVLAAARSRSHELPLAEHIYTELVHGDALEDDLALLAIELVGLGHSIEMRLEANPMVLTRMRRTLGRWLLGEGLSEEERFSVVLAASEAAGNAVEHAYGARDATFALSCTREGDLVRVKVRDSGRWRESQPHGRGRGLTIMRALVDDVEVVRGAKGTTVTLTKRIASDAQ